MSAIGGVHLKRRLAGDPRGCREALWLAATVPTALFLTFCYYGSRIAGMPQGDWNGARVTPSVALARGYDLYYGPEHGPIMTTHYGPVKALWYLPAGLAATPTSAILIAGTLQVAVVLVPLLLFHRGVSGQSLRSRIIGLGGFVVAANAILITEGTRQMATRIHVDAPAVGLGLMACQVLATARARPRRRQLAAAAALTVLAAWSKQVEAPLAGAQLVYLGWCFGRRAVGAYLVWLASLGLLASLAFFAVFGFEEMMFNLVILPSRLSWQGDWRWFLLSLVELFIASSPALLILLFALRRRLVGGDLRPGIIPPAWFGPALAALALVPTSVTARLIHGGDQNSYHTLYYLLAAASLALAETALNPGEGRRRGIRVLAILMLAALLWAPSWELPRHLLRVDDNPQQQAYAFARAHPHQAYFPWNPLSTLMAEGELYHFDYTVNDRRRSGFEPTREHFRGNLPAKMRYLIYHRNGLGEAARAQLPEYDTRITVDGLPAEDWVVYVRAADAAAAAGDRASPGSSR